MHLHQLARPPTNPRWRTQTTVRPITAIAESNQSLSTKLAQIENYTKGRMLAHNSHSNHVSGSNPEAKLESRTRYYKSPRRAWVQPMENVLRKVRLGFPPLRRTNGPTKMAAERQTCCVRNMPPHFSGFRPAATTQLHRFYRRSRLAEAGVSEKAQLSCSRQHSPRSNRSSNKTTGRTVD